MSTFELDSTYSALTGARINGIQIPTVEHSEVLDVIIDRVWHADSGRFTGWRALAGHTHQKGYNGAVFLSSETVTDGQVLRWVSAAGGDVFAIVEVRDVDAEEDDDISFLTGIYTEDNPTGWAIIYRTADVYA